MRVESSCARVRHLSLAGLLAAGMLATGCSTGAEGKGTDAIKVPEAKQKLKRIEELQNKAAPTKKSR